MKYRSLKRLKVVNLEIIQKRKGNEIQRSEIINKKLFESLVLSFKDLVSFFRSKKITNRVGIKIVSNKILLV